MRLLRLTLLLAIVLAIFPADLSAAAFVDPYEPDNSMETASQITVDGVERLQFYEGAWVSGTTHDWLKFEATAGKLYLLKVRRGTVWSYPQATAYSPTGSPLGFEWEKETDGMTWLFYADTSGTHYVDLALNSYGETGTYWVSVQEGDPASFSLADEYEPDNTLRSAKDIPVDGTVQTRAADDVDYARFATTAGKVYRVDVGWVEPSTYLISSVVRSNGAEVLGRKSVGTTGQTRYFKALASEVLYLKVGESPGSVNKYKLAITELKPSALYGTVIESLGGAPVPGARITIYPTDQQGYYGSPDPIAGTTVAAEDGTWSYSSLLPGNYSYRVEDPTGRLLPEYYSGIVEPKPFMTPIHVGEEATATGLVSALRQRSGVVGTVIRTDTGAPVANAVVSLSALVPGAYWYQAKSLGSRTTGADGTFSYSGLDARMSHTLTTASVAGLVPTGPLSFSMSQGATATVTVLMTTPAHISGRVTCARTGVPLKNKMVSVYQRVGALVGTVATDSDGRYDITLNEAGAATIVVDDPANVYQSRWWNDGTTQNGSRSYLDVAMGNTYSGTDVALEPVDQTPPVTIATASSAWSAQDVQVSLAATDPSGVSVTRYAIDASNAETYTAPFFVRGDGVHSVAYSSADKWKNWETTKTVQVRIDQRSPQTALNVLEQGWGWSRVGLSATDAGSGVATTHYRLDGSASVTYTAEPLMLDTPGAHLFEIWSQDAVGNVEIARTVAVWVSSATAIAGANRYATALESSKKAFPEGAPCVVIATGANWPDALGGASLAAAKGGPILLTPQGALPADVLAEVRRLGAGEAVVLGGEAAVGPEVYSSLTAVLGPENVTRIGGAGRYQTAELVAKATAAELGDAYDGTFFVATGGNFPDALGASPLAAAQGWPLLLASPTGLSSSTWSTLQAIGGEHAVILGGTGAVSTSVETALRSVYGPSGVERLAGASRYETAKIVAAYGVANAGLSWDKLAVATGQNFPDALAGGVLQGRDGSVMLLTPSATLDPHVRTALSDNKAGIHEVRFLGGTGAVSQSVRDQVASALQ